MKSGSKSIKKLISLCLIATGVVACADQQKIIEDATAPGTVKFVGHDGAVSYSCEQTVSSSLDWVECAFVADTDNTPYRVINTCWQLNYINPYTSKYYLTKFKKCFQVGRDTTQQAIIKSFAIRNSELVEVKALCGDKLEQCLLRANATYYNAE